MNNHFHLLIKTRQANLQKFMQRFNTSYTMYYNRRHNRSGHLYQGRYKAILVDADAYLLELSRYIHLNPVKTGRYRKASAEQRAEILKQYRWSSYPGYVQLPKRQDTVIYKEVLSILSGADNTGARQNYRAFMIDGLAKDSTPQIWEQLQAQAILGSDSFVDRIYEQYLKKRRKDTREQRGLEEIGTTDLSIEHIARQVAKEYSTAPEVLYQNRSPHTEARSVFMELCRRYMTKKQTLSGIGAKLGISIAALGQNAKRIRAKMVKEKRLQNRFTAIEKKLLSKQSK